MIRLCTLGRLTLEHEGGGPSAASVLAQPKRLALLVYLAAGYPPAPRSRDTLIALLWPELDQAHARTALRQCLLGLRRSLGAGVLTGKGEEQVGVDSARLWCDAAAFGAALAEGRPADAVALYGGAFMEGFHVADAPEFERWLERERRRLEVAAAAAAWTLVDAAEAAGNDVLTRHRVERALELAPYDELGFRRYLQILQRQGDLGTAVTAFAAFSGRLEEDLGVEPSAETIALIREIRSAPLTLRPGDAAAPRSLHAIPARASRPPAAPSAAAEPAQSTLAPAAKRFRWLPWAAAAGGIALIGALAGLLIGLGGAGVFPRDRPAVEGARDANLLAVTPFEVLEPSLQVWREGMGDVLSRTLDGAGPIRTVPPTVTFRGWSGRADQASAEELGRRTGAGLVLYGAVMSRGRDSVTIRAALLDRVSGMAKTDIEVTGGTARIGELADSLGIRVLRVLSSGRAIGAVRRTSMASKSLPALKAFLQGEQFHRRGMWDSAATRYEQAIAADSTFALAMVGMAGVLSWSPPTAGAYRPAEEYMRRATRHNHGLPARDSLLIVADSFGFAAEEATEPEAWVRLQFRTVAAVEEAVRRYPEDPRAWHALGELRMFSAHFPWPIARPPAASLDAFFRAIALDPGFAPPYEHVPELLLALGRTEEARRNAAAYLALDSTSHNPDKSAIRLAALLLSPSAADRAEAERMLDTASIHTLYESVFGGGLDYWPDTAETAIRVLRRLGEPGRGAGGAAPWVLDSVSWPKYLARALAFRGHLREAFTVNEHLLRQPSASEWSRWFDTFHDLSMLGIVPDSLARATFGRSLESAAGWEDPTPPRHLRGLPWWLSRGDTVALARFGAIAARTASAPPTPRAALQARLLGEMSVAFLDLARGDSTAAIRKLRAIPDTLCLADNAGTCFHLNRTLARLLAARGEDRAAGALLDRWRWSGGSTPSFVFATLELGRISERLGDRRKAAECYGFVVATWRRPDPELLPSVAEAREGLARLAVR